MPVTTQSFGNAAFKTHNSGIALGLGEKTSHSTTRQLQKNKAMEEEEPCHSPRVCHGALFYIDILEIGSHSPEGWSASRHG